MPHSTAKTRTAAVQVRLAPLQKGKSDAARRYSLPMLTLETLSAVAPEADAANLYWAGYRLRQISEMLDINYNTLISWKNRDKWDDAPIVKKITASVQARYVRVVGKPDKTDKDIKELAALGGELERLAKIERYANSGNGADLNPKLSQRRKGKKLNRNDKNHFTDEALKQLNDAYQDGMFAYQREWDAASHHRIRNYLKSRQIGATYHIAREKLIRAVNQGINQIFLSASKAQAHVFKGYMKQMAMDACGVELSGDPIVLPNGATLYFLGTNSKTAQSYHGDFIFDEYFWTQNFKELRKVASGMAMQKMYTQTYLSTPSTINHEAYPFWTGEQHNAGRKLSDQVSIDVSHAALKNGRLCEDGQYRQMITIEDALAGGNDRFDIEQLRLQYNDQDYQNLLMCQFVNDTHSIFSLLELQRCMVDSWVVWDDFEPLLLRPFGNRPVWLGYDPSRMRDDASLCVLAPPAVKGAKFRVLEKFSWNGIDFESQAKYIYNLCQKYNVEHMGIDVSGMGVGVFELVKKFYPGATPITYSVEVKNRMVLKTKQLISRRQIEFDAGWTDLALAFLTIHKAGTPSGRQISYQSSRTATTGHADLAWSLMHAIDKLPLQMSDDIGRQNQSFMEIY